MHKADRNKGSSRGEGGWSEVMATCPEDLQRRVHEVNQHCTEKTQVL